MELIKEMFAPFWTMSIRIGIVLFFLIFFSPGTYADIVAEGYHKIGYEYVVFSNLGNYSDYVFISPNSEIIDKVDTIVVIEGSPAFSFPICAIKAKDFNLKDFNRNAWRYLENCPYIICSKRGCVSGGAIEDASHVEFITFYLKIDSITNQSLEISEIKRLYTYTNGSTNEVQNPIPWY